MNSVLVTGAAGFIAYHLIEDLLKKGVPVVGIDNFDPHYPRSQKEKNISDLLQVSRLTKTPFFFEEQDILHLDASAPFLPREASSISTVIHLAAKAGIRPSLIDPIGYWKTNTEGILRILEFCKTRSISKLLFGSSSSVYGDTTPIPFREDAPADQAISPYGASKRAAEILCHTYSHLYSLKIACLRFFTVYGPRQRPDLAIHKFTQKILNKEPITLFGSGNTQRDYTYVTDIAAGIQKADAWLSLQQSGTCEVFNLGGDHPISLSTLIEFLEKSTSQKAMVENTGLQPGDMEKTWADLNKSWTHLHYSPTVSIQDGIHHFVDWFKTQKNHHYG